MVDQYLGQAAPKSLAAPTTLNGALLSGMPPEQLAEIYSLSVLKISRHLSTKNSKQPNRRLGRRFEQCRTVCTTLS
jgi:hypothetical protein